MFRKRSNIASDEKLPWVRGSVPAGSPRGWLRFLGGPASTDPIADLIRMEVLLTAVAVAAAFQSFWAFGITFVILSWSMRHPRWVLFFGFLCSVTIGVVAGAIAATAMKRSDAGWVCGILIFLCVFSMNVEYVRRASS